MASPYLTDFSAGLANLNAEPQQVAGQKPLSRQQQAHGPGQVLGSMPMPLQPSEQVCYLGHWPDLLADLELLGRVWIETEQPGLRIAQRQRLGGLRVQGMLGHLDRTEYQLRVLLDQCYALASQDDQQSLVIEDATQQPLVRVQLETGTHPLPLRLLLSSFGANGRRVMPVPPQQDERQMAALEQHAIHRLQRDCQALEPEPERHGLGFRDLAELSGRLSLNPVPWRRAAARGDEPAIAVDPSLVPCALETLVDQVHPLALSSGSSGWVSRSIQQFYGHAYVDGQLSLRGDHARLELDVRAIDTAWVVGERAGEIDRRSLRLYDEDGRAMAIIASATAADRDHCADAWSTELANRAEPWSAVNSPLWSQGRTRFRRDETRLWTTLMNALTS
ncbi:MAG: hypothetical protein VBE63_03010 [Lamprobacter sp.]|uniref:hypothetical protein n=1 Tax=Lamprobacter sp. TaxID=3100796 RepID=UPI002B25B7CE|nr:hypothetical protein [Lamprobacter sp.]MEA3638896.1 hypothetical protein [Lamprobacter sp.]